MRGKSLNTIDTNNIIEAIDINSFYENKKIPEKLYKNPIGNEGCLGSYKV